MTSIIDVAKFAGVSISTVSRVMNDHPNVSEGKRRAVIDAVKELNYVPNALAQGLVKKKTNSIAILISDITNIYYAYLVKSIEETLNAEGYHILIGNTEWNNNKEKEYIQYMLQKQVDGFILVSSTLDKDYLDKLVTYGVPIVMFDRESQVDRIDYIRVDDFRGGYIAGEHLIKCGYKNIIHLSGLNGLASAEDRKKGIIQSIKDANFDKDNYKVVQGAYTEESGIRIMNSLLDEVKTKGSHGIFAANDAMALGVLKVLNDNGVDCPGEVGLVGFDNISFTQYTNPPLTTIERPISKIGNIAAEIILQRIDTEKHSYNNQYQSINLDVKLVKRGSTK